VRYLFYRLLNALDFKAQFIVARKIEKVFRNSFEANENRFYDHLTAKLFRNNLHKFAHNHIIFAARGSRSRQRPLEKAIEQASAWFEEKDGAECSSFTVQPQSPKGESCLSIFQTHRIEYDYENKY
jgi:hypothetical protein